MTWGRWFRRGSPSTSSTDPQAPALGSVGPEHDLGDAGEHDRPRAHRAGLKVTYSVASRTRQLPNTFAASRIARISAWAVGSWRRSRSLWAAAITCFTANDHRADRHIVVFKCLLGLMERECPSGAPSGAGAVDSSLRSASLRESLRPQPRHTVIIEDQMKLIPHQNARARPSCWSPSRAAAFASTAAAAPRRIVIGYGPQGSATAQAAGVGDGSSEASPERTQVVRRRLRHEHDGRSRPGPQPPGGRVGGPRLGRPRRRRRANSSPMTREPGTKREAGATCSGTSWAPSGSALRKRGKT